MNVFMVYISGDPVDEPTQRLKERYPAESEHFQMSERLYLVSADGIAQSVADNIGFGDDLAGSTGVVFKLNASYAGYERRAMWDWLQLVEQNVG